MKRYMICAVFCGMMHCMGVQVPEEYTSDLYYSGETKIMSATPSAGMNWTTLSQTIRVQYNNPMLASSVIADLSGNCSGNLKFYDTNNTACRAITAVSWEKRDSIITATLAGGDLDPNSDYTLTVGGDITDFRGKTLGTDAVYAFKSGVPAGTEPRVLSVTAGLGSSTWDVTVVFSRPMQTASLGIPQENICGSNIDLQESNGNCNPQYRTLTTSDNITYKVGYKVAPSAATLTFIVKKDVLDRFSIPLSADYTATIVVP
jgi:Bacterial Ig-like domain